MITGRTEVYGIIGYPVDHSISPAMQTAAFDALGIDAVYVPFSVEPDHLREAVLGLKALNVKGFNVTIPHKERILNLLDDVNEKASFLGAVNTVKSEGQRFIGYNTDADGFSLSLKKNKISVKSKIVTMFGAGGAARAVGFAIAGMNPKVLNIVNRNIQKAEVLSQKLSGFCETKAFGLNEAGSLVPSSDIIVNTTPVGMNNNNGKLFDYKLIPESIVVIDIIYKPFETELLKQASQKHCKTLNGLDMLVLQGVASFEIWTDRKAPVSIMEETCLSALKVED